MRLVPVFLAALVALPVFANAFDGGSMGNGFQVDGYDEYQKREDTSHVGMCMSRLEAEARRRNVRLTSLSGTLVPSNGAMVLGAIGEFENGSQCECAWNNPILNCN